MKTLTRSIAAIVVIFAAALPGAKSHEASSLLIPTELEAFAERTDTVTNWGRQIANIASNGTQMLVAAVELENHQEPVGRMKGVRILLQDENTSDEVYLGMKDLERIKSAAEQLDWEIRTFPDKRPKGPHCHGLAEF